ncbi:MAG: cytochrome c oxidase subunit 2A [Chloroflexi bacterium]|nr:cytochrome c oxidase subunit 2A [Chloroflexota bacterium]
MKEEHPKGTLTIMLIFALSIVVLWSWVFLTLMERGMTR